MGLCPKHYKGHMNWTFMDVVLLGFTVQRFTYLWILMCVCSVLLAVKHFPQISHVKGFSPEEGRQSYKFKSQVMPNLQPILNIIHWYHSEAITLLNANTNSLHGIQTRHFLVPNTQNPLYHAAEYSSTDQYTHLHIYTVQSVSIWTAGKIYVPLALYSSTLDFD